MLSVGVSAASAQLEPPIALDPRVAGQGTSLLLIADESLLAPRARPARSIAFALPRGMRIDTTARERLCTNREAARAVCPESSRIGFGRFGLAVRGYLPDGGETELVWALDAYLGEAQSRRDPASVVLTGKLLGADSVAALLAPVLGTSVPTTSSTAGRLVRVASGRYGVELRFAELPAALAVAAPATATPARFELALGAVRRTRRNFTRRVEVRTLDGYEVRQVRDHRLIAHDLLRTPRTCRGSWRGELRVGLADGVERSPVRLGCARAATRRPA